MAEMLQQLLENITVFLYQVLYILGADRQTLDEATQIATLRWKGISSSVGTKIDGFFTIQMNETKVPRVLWVVFWGWKTIQLYRDYFKSLRILSLTNANL